MAVQASEQRRSRGRPRDPDLEDRVKRGALEVLAREGVSGLTVDKICEHAGVSRTSFYRRWSSPLVAAAEAFNEAFDFGDLVDKGDVEAELLDFSLRARDLYRDPTLGGCVGFIVSELRIRPEAFGPLAAGFLQRRARNRQIVSRAIFRGDIAADIDPDMVIDVLHGLAINSWVTARPLDAAMLRTVIRSLLRRPIRATDET